MSGYNVCQVCGKMYDGWTKFCSRKCYQRNWYLENKNKRDEYFKKRYEGTYIKKEKPPKRTAEEKKEYSRKYYQEHKEYYRERSRKYHLEHKNDEHYKQRKRKNLIAYLERRKMKECEGGNYGVRV